MNLCKTRLLCLSVVLFAATAAFCQRGMIGLEVGQTSDKFDSLSSVSGLQFGADGQVTVLQNNPKNGRPAIVAGGEVRFSADTSQHAREYAVFGGPMFPIRNFSIGFNVQVRKIVLPAADVDNQVFNRSSMRLLELPVVVKYSFGSDRRAFVQAEGAPEFTPHFKASSLSGVSLPNPSFDHGYFVRGTVGYVVGHWYAKASYETRYFKFLADPGNPSGLYNWRNNLVTGGVGFAF